MAISYVGVATTNPAGIATSVDAAIPTHSAGDLLIASVAENRANTFNGAPAGWTLLDTMTETAMVHVVLYRVADGTEGSTVTFAFSSTTAQNLAIVTAYSGVDPTTPFIAHSGAINSGTASASVVTPSVSNTSATAWAVAAFSARQVAATGSLTTPTNMTERADIECGLTTTAEMAHSWDDRANAPTGAQSYTSTYVGSTAQSIGWLGFLNPATGGSSFSASASLSGSGTLSTAVTPAATASVNLSGGGSLTTTRTVGLSSSASLGGVGALSASVVPQYKATFGGAATGTLSATAVVGTGPSAFVNFSGSGALTASPAPALSVSASLSSFGSLSASTVKTEAPLPSFTPPTHPVAMPNRGTWSRYSIQEGESVVRVDGTLQLLPYPSADDLVGVEGRDWFLGGRTYNIDAATATELQNAGFTTDA